MHHLIYRSQATAPLDATQLTQLLERARAFNQRHDLTGLLLYSPDHQFLQVIEGKEDVVRALYHEHIAFDGRHRDLFVLSEGPLLHRSFPNWRMSLLTADHPEAAPAPAFLALSPLRQVLAQLVGGHPGLRRLLRDFIERWEPAG